MTTPTPTPERFNHTALKHITYVQLARYFDALIEQLEEVKDEMNRRVEERYR